MKSICFILLFFAITNSQIAENNWQPFCFIKSEDTLNIIKVTLKGAANVNSGGSNSGLFIRGVILLFHGSVELPL